MHLVTEKKDQEDRPQPEPLRNRADPRPHNNTQVRNTGHLERSFAQAAQGRVDKLNSEFETVQAAITLLRHRVVQIDRESEVLDDFLRFSFCNECIYCEACVQRFPISWNPRYFKSNEDVIPLDQTPDCTRCISCSDCADQRPAAYPAKNTLNRGSVE